MTLPLPTPVPIPSGWYYPPQYNIPGIYLFNTYGVCNYLQAFMGNGTGKIFEGYNGLYLMGTPSGVMFSTNDVDFTRISGYASSITQIENSQLTVIFKNTLGINVNVESQLIPETYGNWVNEGTINGITISDSVGDPDALVGINYPILIGNSRSNAFSRIFRNDTRTSPLGIFIDSDAGIPQTLPSIAQITELEAV